ncbi:MAG TPA: hypothetical protein VNS58_12480 [Puia sp.]|nr:hypothetical protein [Puia sp.]
MAINQNHLFEELNGVKCAIVEKNVTGERVDFLRRILEYNRYTVVVVPSPPPKATPATVPAAPAPAEGSGLADTPASVPASETFTIGVTDVVFNPVNAVFGRLLKAPGGHIVTLAYWQQQENEPDNEKPYFDGR